MIVYSKGYTKAYLFAFPAFDNLYCKRNQYNGKNKCSDNS